MRTLIALVALVAPTLAALTAQHADACGGYGRTKPRPAAYALAFSGEERARQFVVFGSAGPESEAEPRSWERIGDGTHYDYTQIAPGPLVSGEFEVTLLAAGTTTVRSTQALSFLRADPRAPTMLAAEVEQSTVPFVLALRGRHEDAKLVSPAWDVAGEVWALPGTTYSLTYEALDGTLVLRDRTQVLTTLDGTPLGVVTMNAATYLAIRRGQGVSLIHLPG